MTLSGLASTGYQSENLEFYQVMVIVTFSFSQVYEQTLKFLWIFVFNLIVNEQYFLHYSLPFQYFLNTKVTSLLPENKVRKMTNCLIDPS
jgi:hypothetical protein